MQRIQEMLRREDMTLHEIAESIHMSLRWARAYVKHLHDAGCVHISGYRRVPSSCKTVNHALYCWGAATDAVKPAPLTPLERVQRSRQNLFQDADKHALALEKRRMSKWVPHCDWAAEWVPKYAKAATVEAV